jgi:hypothetical protein
MGPIPMTIFLNEVETDPNIVASIPGNMVAMVKVYSNFVGAPGNGPGGALAIYTKKDSDLSSVIPSKGSFIRYKGYSISKEFYSPDYSINTSRPESEDRRITLQWIPDIFISAVDAKVPFIFYNNTRTRSFRIIVEGLTADGKMVFIEKLISYDKKSF